MQPVPAAHHPWTAEAQFIVPDWGDKVDFVLGLSYRPVRLHRLAGRNDNAIVDFIPQ